MKPCPLSDVIEITPNEGMRGRLVYQACDDRTCDNPVSLLLSWTFTAGALDCERATIIRTPRQ